MPKFVAYCRVSPHSKPSSSQLNRFATTEFHVDEDCLFSESISVNVLAFSRPVFRKLCNALEAGDVLVVDKLDGLGRSVTDVFESLSRLIRMGARVYCLALGNFDLSTPLGLETMKVIGAVAEFERGMKGELTRTGMARARAEGTAIGRPPILNSDQSDEVAVRLSAGESIASIAKAMKTSRQTIMRKRDKLRTFLQFY